MNLLLSIAIVLGVGLLVGFAHHRILRRPNLGGTWAAMGVAFLGAVIGAFAFDWVLCRLMDLIAILFDGINWLMGNMDARILPPINVLASVLGAILLVVIYHKVSPGRGDR